MYRSDACRLLVRGRTDWFPLAPVVVTACGRSGFRVGALSRRSGFGLGGDLDEGDRDVVGGTGLDRRLPQRERGLAAVVATQYRGDCRVVEGVGEPVAADQVASGFSQ